MPLAIEETHLDSSLVPGYSVDDAEQSLYETLGRRYGLRLDSGEQRIVAVECRGHRQFTSHQAWGTGYPHGSQNPHPGTSRGTHDFLVPGGCL